MFSYRLTRLPFAILMYAHSFWSAGLLVEEGTKELLVVLLSLPLLFLFVVLPRLRDCDWPLWFGFLLLVPFLGSLMGLALIFAPPKTIGRREHAVETPPDETAPPQLAGSPCAACGTKIVLASEAVLQEGKVFCKSCHDTGASPAG
jgi:hypothetical protein